MLRLGCASMEGCPRKSTCVLSNIPGSCRWTC